MQEEKVWRSVVVACMMIGVANVGAAPQPVEEYNVTINTSKLFHIIDERFLSLTIDPALLLFGKEFRWAFLSHCQTLQFWLTVGVHYNDTAYNFMIYIFNSIS